MTIINVTNARTNLYKPVESVINSSKPVFITGKSGNLVVIPEEDYHSIEETLYLTSIPGLAKKIVEGINTPLDECVVDDEVLPEDPADG
ncbi:MAG: type II toxin-antitoxin system Phd/YefM family antitoxin [Pseudomonadota bacterium]|nr:type II toxin-antitoxin system Phd/YefM family antitoxin [Pseudomonadota bacterium]